MQQSNLPMVVFELISTNRHTNKSSYTLYLTREGAITYSGYPHGDWRHDADGGFWHAANADSSYQIRPRSVIVTQEGDIRPLDAMRRKPPPDDPQGLQPKARRIGGRLGTIGAWAVFLAGGYMVVSWGVQAASWVMTLILGAIR
jgi:hypothetical protein